MNDEARSNPERPSASTRTEQLGEQLGEQIGRQLGRLYHGLQTLGSGATPSSESNQDDTASTEPTARAEQLVSRGEHLLGEYTSRAYHGIRRIAARAREEYDDITAEARALERGEPGGTDDGTAEHAASTDQKSGSGQA